jgi:hypothetical protein
MRMATVRPVWGLRLPIRPQKPLNCLECERRDLNPHALRHWILSPARLPFRHSRCAQKYSKIGQY